MPISAGQNINPADFVSTSSGASDSGKVPKLDANGVLNLDHRPAKFSTTQVFNSTSPTSYTDLDLSAVVGNGDRALAFDTNSQQDSDQFSVG